MLLNMPHSDVKEAAAADIAIVPYRDAFKAQIGALIPPIQQKEFGIPITYEDQPDLQDITGFYQKNSGNFWVALHDGNVVGTIALLVPQPHVGVLRKMFVQKEYRGAFHRLGQRLLDTLMAWAEAHEVREIFLGTTEAFTAAHRFYEKNGFRRLDNDALPAAIERIRMKVDTRHYHKSVAPCS